MIIIVGRGRMWYLSPVFFLCVLSDLPHSGNGHPSYGKAEYAGTDDPGHPDPIPEGEYPQVPPPDSGYRVWYPVESQRVESGRSGRETEHGQRHGLMSAWSCTLYTWLSECGLTEMMNDGMHIFPADRTISREKPWRVQSRLYRYGEMWWRFVNFYRKILLEKL